MEPTMLSSLQDRIDPAHTAILLIDMQKDLVYDGFLCDQAGRDLAATRSVIPTMGRLLTAARSSGAAVSTTTRSSSNDRVSSCG